MTQHDLRAKGLSANDVSVLDTAVAETDWSSCPPDLADGLRRWVEAGIWPGSFLRLLLCNDLVGTYAHAADAARIGEVVEWVDRHLPWQCWGSRARCAQWHASTLRARTTATAETRNKDETRNHDSP